MKQLVIIILCIGYFQLSSCQSNPVDEVFNRYSGKEGFTTIDLTSDLLNMFASFVEDEKHCDKSFTNSKLDNIRLLVQESKQPNAIDFYNDIYLKVNKSEYKELMTIREEDEKINMLVKEQKGVIKEFLMIVADKDENVLIQIKGNIEMKDLKNISKSIDISGLEKLSKLKNIN